MKTVYRQLISIPIIKPIKSSTQSIQLRSIHHQSISRTDQKPILFKPYDGHSSLYLHPTTGSVSFLSDFPSKLQSVTILGSFSKDGKSFETHEPFLELMHQTFSNAFQYDPHVLGIARSCQATGYLHVYGLYLFLNLMIINSKTKKKTIPRSEIWVDWLLLLIIDQRQSISSRNHRGGQGSESIIFSFLGNSQSGQPVPKTYQPNPTYRLWTPNEGFLVLPLSLESILIKACNIAREIEIEEKWIQIIGSLKTTTSFCRMMNEVGDWIVSMIALMKIKSGEWSFESVDLFLRDLV